MAVIRKIPDRRFQLFTFAFESKRHTINYVTNMVHGFDVPEFNNKLISLHNIGSTKEGAWVNEEFMSFIIACFAKASAAKFASL